MSALAFVCKSDRAEILTDSLSVDSEDGRVSDLGSKQVFVGSSGVVAMNGWALPCDLFAALAVENCSDFDDLVNRTPELWDLVGRAVRAEFPQERYRYEPFIYVAALVGWSASRRRAEGYMFDSLTGGSVGRPITAFAMGGGNDGAEDTLAFIRRFYREPEEFNAQRDGIPLFEKMRQSSTDLGDVVCHTVGGSIQHSIVSASGIKDASIHTWAADRLGERVRAA
ncbi:hypothetical protein [Bradyrhizobium sp. RT3a]|uniref:hypothetical protein n=1 Tax=unclassified Bradyrhizobium TaxID=2631580 RepID=UPI0033998719